jgi:hypothetical protein
MRIGLDFDNTIARYDHIFTAEAKQEKFVSIRWKGTKKQLRDTLRSLEGGDIMWQKLQGRVYGPMMSQAELFPGVVQFMLRCKHRGDDLFIISHKTEYGHFDQTETPLRQAALHWMTECGFFKKTKCGLSQEQVFFESTRSEKVSRISSLDLDVFVDDLKEVFAEDDFPNIKKILFTTDTDEKEDVVNCNNWSSISNKVLGPITDEDCKRMAQTITKESILKVQKIRGRGNSRIYQVVTETNQKYALKYYPDLLIDPRKRLQIEIQSYNLLEDYNLTPKVIKYDTELNIAIFEWIEGVTLQSVEDEHIDQALEFIKILEDIKTPEYSQPASEACTSAYQLFYQIEDRLRKLETLEDNLLHNFLNTVFKPLYQDVKNWSKYQWPANNLRESLTKTKQTLSPSDFGFHNSILRIDGTMCFLDLEYFGWDDPVKLISDFIWHPAMILSYDQKKRWLENSFMIFKNTEEIQERFHAAWPLYGMRWAMILLNEFHKDGWEKKLHVDENMEKLREQKLCEQVNKTTAVCDLIKSHQMECPYV